MGPASNPHFRNNLILGQGAAPEIFAVDTFTNYSTSDYNGFRPNPGARVLLRLDFAAASMSRRITKEAHKRTFKTLEEYSAATGQDAHSVLVDYDVFVKVRTPDPSTRRNSTSRRLRFSTSPGRRPSMPASSSQHQR